MSVWLFARMIKWLGVIAFGAGVLGSHSPDPAVRRRAGFGYATVGFVLSWVSGYVLLKISGVSMGAPWISGSLLGSIVSLNAAILCAESDRPRPAVAGVGALALVLTLALMVWRPV